MDLVAARTSAWAAAALGLLAAGCASSIRVSTHGDPSAPFATYRTFDWVSPADTSDDPRFPGLRKAGRQEIAAGLETKGYLRAERGEAPDFRVQFYAFLQKEKEVLEDEEDVHQTDTTEPPLPPADSASPGHPRAEPPSREVEGEGAVVEAVEVAELETGDLVVEVLDGRSSELVWRGIGRGIADEKAPQGELLQALRRVIERFPEVAHRP